MTGAREIRRHALDSLSPVLGGEGWGEGPSENDSGFNASAIPTRATRAHFSC